MSIAAVFDGGQIRWPSKNWCSPDHPKMTTKPFPDLIGCLMVAAGTTLALRSFWERLPGSRDDFEYYATLMRRHCLSWCFRPKRPALQLGILHATQETGYFLYSSHTDTVLCKQTRSTGSVAWNSKAAFEDARPLSLRSFCFPWGIVPRGKNFKVNQPVGHTAANSKAWATKCIFAGWGGQPIYLKNLWVCYIYKWLANR